MDYQIVPMTKKHLPGIQEIDRYSFETPWSLKSLETELTNPLAVYFVATMQTKVVGYCGYWWIFDEGQITNIAVHPDYRKHGIGKRLMQTMINQCAETDIATLTLEVRKSNEAARSLYEKLGFQEVGLRPNYYRDKEDAVLMTLEVPKND